MAHKWPTLVPRPPSTMPWDIGSYMRTFNSFVKTGLPVKLGVGFIDNVRYSKLTSNILNTHHSVFITRQQDSGPARKRHRQERLPNAGMEVLYGFRLYTCTIRQSFRQVLIVEYSGRPCDLIYSTAISAASVAVATNTTTWRWQCINTSASERFAGNVKDRCIREHRPSCDTVEYAPEIGGLGFDMEATATRLEVFKEVYSL